MITVRSYKLMSKINMLYRILQIMEKIIGLLNLSGLNVSMRHEPSSWYSDILRIENFAV